MAPASARVVLLLLVSLGSAFALAGRGRSLAGCATTDVFNQHLQTSLTGQVLVTYPNQTVTSCTDACLSDCRCSGFNFATSGNQATSCSLVLVISGEEASSSLDSYRRVSAPVDPAACGVDRGTFTVQNSVNFPGFNLGTLYSSTFTGCGQACLARCECVGFVFKTDNTCLLKSALKSGSVDKQARTAFRAKSPNPANPSCGPGRGSFTSESRIGYLGFDLMTPMVNTQAGCTSLCLYDCRCVGFSFNTATRKCAIKSALVTRTVNTDVTTFYRSDPSVPPPPALPDCGPGTSNFSVTAGVNYIGSDISSYLLQSHTSCQRLCLSQCACVAYVLAPNGVCRLKSALIYKSFVAGTILGKRSNTNSLPPSPKPPAPILPPSPPKVCPVDHGTDFTYFQNTFYAGANLAAFAGQDTPSCSRQCLRYCSCIGFVLSKGGLCNLKSALTSHSTNKLWVSGVRTGGVSTSAPPAVEVSPPIATATPSASPPAPQPGNGCGNGRNAFTLKNGVNFPNNNLVLLNRQSIVSCQNACSANCACVGFVFNNLNGACHLKTALLKSVKEANSVTGFLENSPNPPNISPPVMS